MDGGEQQTTAWRHELIETGEWAGWYAYGNDPFEDLAGPFYYRKGEDGRPICAVRAEPRHMNGGGFMHGGCMMTFADFALFSIATRELQGTHAVTLSLGCEYIGPAHEGDLVECTGEVLKAGKSMVFVRGLIFTGDNPMMSFSGVIKKVGRRL